LLKKAAYNAGIATYNDWKHGNIGSTGENISVKNFMQNWLENFLSLNALATSMQIYYTCRNLTLGFANFYISKRGYFFTTLKTWQAIGTSLLIIFLQENFFVGRIIR